MNYSKTISSLEFFKMGDSSKKNRLPGWWLIYSALQFLLMNQNLTPKKMLCSIRLEKSLEKGSRMIFLTPDIHACVLERMTTWKKMRWWAQPTTPNNAKSSSAENRPRNGALSMRSTCAKIESDKPVISTKWQLHECMVV